LSGQTIWPTAGITFTVPIEALAVVFAGYVAVVGSNTKETVWQFNGRPFKAVRLAGRLAVIIDERLAGRSDNIVFKRVGGRRDKRLAWALGERFTKRIAKTSVGR